MRRLIKNMGQLGLLLAIASSCDSERVITQDALPEPATAYIQAHFAEQDILQAIKDRDGLSVTYDVVLQGGYQLEFSRNGEIKQIDGSAKLPDSAIPATILEYVHTNFPGEDIIDWELGDRGEEVKLANGIELEFDKQGNFVKMDR